MPILDMTRFVFNGDVLRSVSELVFDEVVKGPDLNMIHTVYPNIVTQTQIGFIGKGGLVGVKNQGCDPTPQDWSVGTRDVKFDPVAWEILIAACWTELEASAAVYSLHKGVNIADFSDTDYMTILMEVLTNSMNEFMYRFIWFSDVDAANIADGGEITDGVAVKYFNLLDGLFKQMDVQIGVNPKQHVPIAENAGADYDAQIVAADKAVGYLRKAYRAAPIALRNLRNKFYLVTQGIYDAYVESLQSACCLETTYQNLVNGMTTVSFNGIPLIAMTIWDEIIASYCNDEAKNRYINPNRIVLTAPEVLAVGVDDPNAFDSVKSWYNPDERKVKIEAMGKGDVKLANPALFVYGV
ncbi:hypothetical protein K0H02_05615 [Bacteroides fragilis]|nr:hypothetical protein [Bacteroides fragilis]